MVGHLVRRHFVGVFLRALVAAAILSCCPAPTRAADISWRRPEGGTFSSAGSWFGGVVPGAGDIAHFGLSTSGPLGNVPAYTVSFSALASNIRLLVEDDSVVFDLNGLVYETTNPAIGMALGTVSGKTGRLTVTDGIVTLPFQSDLEIASIAGGGGSLTVGAGGKVLGTMELLVGLNGAGGLLISNNGDVIADAVTLGKNLGSTGAATITGPGSSLLAAGLQVGGMGMGILDVLAGGRVDSASGRISSAVNTATATVSDAGSKWTVSGQLLVGFETRGSLSITNGGIVQDRECLIGVVNTAGQFGFVEVKDANSRWTHQEELEVGVGGHGTLSITNGGLVENIAPGVVVAVGKLGGFGTVDVDGANSKWLIASDLTVGTSSSADNVINITGGGFVQCAHAILGETLSLGNNQFDRGTVIVTDPGSQWLASSIDVGFNGSGTLKVLAGGRVDVASNVSVGRGNLGGVGEVLVDGFASALIIDGQLTVGGNVAGTLNITGGGVVQCATVKMPSGVGVGSVVVSGAGSTWAIGDDLVGGPTGGGRGALRIQPGGLVTVGDAITLNVSDELHLEGGALRARTIEFVGSTAPFDWSSGRLSIDAIELLDFVIPSGGVLAPGRELGETFVDGHLLAEPGGATEIQIGGTMPGVTFDQVRVAGSITITNSTLEVAMLNGFVPSPTDAFTVMSSLSGAFSGSFGNIPSGQRLMTSDGVGSFLVSYGPGSPQVVLSAFQPGIPGDFDHDGDVDGADALVWQRGGSPNPISAADLAAWRGNFGFGALTAAGTSVPEPSAKLSALSAMLLALLAWRRRS